VPKKKPAPADIERGKRIREAYEAIGLSRKDFAAKIDRYYHDVMRLEGGQKPDPETLTLIAEICGVTERWLVRGPSYSAEFQTWLDHEKPPDLLDVELELLASINFPEPHPGAGWYSNALSAWRLGTKRALHERTQVRRKVARSG
jgi:transcriptional regulator with XRE-family HTH domain